MSDSHDVWDRTPNPAPEREVAAAARDYVLTELERLREDLSGPPNGLSILQWEQLRDQLRLLDYSIRASLEEGREPDWGIYMKRLSRYCDLPSRGVEFPKPGVLA